MRLFTGVKIEMSPPLALLQMLYEIDQGNAADISGIPDEYIKSAVKKLLKNIGLKKGSKVRLHLKLSGIARWWFNPMMRQNHPL